MDKALKNLIHLPRNEIHNELMRRGLPPDLRVKAFEDLCNAKQQRKAMTARATARARMWRWLLQPLAYELSNARVGRDLKPKTKEPERYAAFTAYVEVLEKLHGGMTRLMLQDENTPVQIAKQQRYPSGGVHWSDWLSNKTKERVSALFDAIPYKKRAKRFIPFQRRMPLRMYWNKRPRVWLATLKSYGFLMSEIQITVDPGRMDKLEATQWRMWHALDEMETKENKAFVPPRWQNTFPDEVWATIDAKRNTPAATELLDMYIKTYHEPYARLLAEAQETVRLLDEEDKELG